MMNTAELFSAVGLYAFQRLMVIYVDLALPLADKAEAADAQDAAEATIVSPTAADRHGERLRTGFQRLIALGLQQYVVLAFACNAVLVWVKAWDWLHPSSCEMALATLASVWFPRHVISLSVNEDKLNRSFHTRSSTLACEDIWNSASLLMVVADFFTCSIALLAVFHYEWTFSEVLRPVRPFWKFWGVKGLLSVNFLQTAVLTAIGSLGGARSSRYFCAFLHFYLVCLESFMLAVLNAFAYPTEQSRWSRRKVDFIEEQDVEEKETSDRDVEAEELKPSPRLVGRPEQP